MMKIKFAAAILFAAALHQQTFSQTLTGTVQSAEQQPLPYVSVTATPKGGHVIEAFTQTDAQGHYCLKLKKYGDWQLTFSSLSYRKDTLWVHISKDVQERNVTLQSEPFTLEEVEIHPNLPIFMKKDTVVFNVASFLRGNEQVIEDVLKNLPGIEVDQQGTIRANGKEVEKVLLDDDDLLNKGYALLTKGLTVKAVKQVELIQGYTENKLAKGLSQSNKVALNLKLEDNAKHRWLGTLSADYGIENKYAGQANLLSVGKRNKHYIVANINNTGYSALTDITKILEIPDTDFSAYAPAQAGLTLPDIERKRINFNQEKMLSGNSIFRPAHKWKIQLSAAADKDNRNAYSQTSQKYKIESSFLNQILQEQVNENPRNYIGKADVSFDLSDKEILQSTTQYHHSLVGVNSSTQFNNRRFKGVLTTTEDFFSQNLNYTNRVSADDLLRINAHYMYSRIPQQYMIDSVGDNVQHQSRSFLQNSTGQKQLFGLKISHLHRFNKKHTLEGHAGIYADTEELSVSLYPVDSIEAGFMQIKTWQYQGGLLYHFSGKKFSFTAGSTLHYNKIHRTDKKNYCWLTPYSIWEWKPNKNHRLNLSWFYKHHYPPFSEVFPYTVHNTLNTSSIGSQDVELLSHHILELEYQYGNWTDNLLANINLLLLKNKRYYASDFYITQEQIYVRKVPLNNRKGASLSGFVSYYVPMLSSSIKLSGEMNYMQYQYLINSIGVQPYKSTGYTCGISFKSAFSGIFNLDIGNTYTRKIWIGENTFITKNNLYADLIFANERWSIDILTEHSYWKGGKNSPSSQYCFIDAKASYMLSPDKWMISLKGENLLNAKTYIENSLNEISLNQFESKLLPRKILISIEYRF